MNPESPEHSIVATAPQPLLHPLPPRPATPGPSSDPTPPSPLPLSPPAPAPANPGEGPTDSGEAPASPSVGGESDALSEPEGYMESFWSYARTEKTGNGFGEPEHPWRSPARTRSDTLVLSAPYPLSPTLSPLSNPFSTRFPATSFSANDVEPVAESSEKENQTTTYLRNLPMPGDLTCDVCATTFDRVSELAELPCGHYYCRECLNKAFAVAVERATLPPVCCTGPIPPDMKQVRAMVPRDLLAQAEILLLELITRNPVYCHKRTCSTFIPPERAGRCLRCNQLTCVSCKKASHEDKPCDSDRGDDAMAAVLLHELAEEKGWQQCFHCLRIIESSEECSLMTCVCGAQFCYNCGEPWRTCFCPDWHYPHEPLYQRRYLLPGQHPRDLARRGDPQHQYVQPHQLIRDEAEFERIRVTCKHYHFRRVIGRHDCEHCKTTQPQYIHQCRVCETFMCRNCRHEQGLFRR